MIILRTRDLHVKTICIISLLLLAFTWPWEKKVDEEKAGDEEPVSVITHVDKKEITIGEKVKYTIKVEAKSSARVRFPEFGENLAEFAIRGFGVIPETGRENKKVYERWYLLDIYLTGEYTIPPVEVNYTTRDGEERVALGKEIPIKVKSLLEGEGEPLEDIEDVEGPVSLPVSYALIAGTGISLGLFILAMVFLFLWLRGRKRGKSIEVSLRPAHEIAYEQLENLRYEELRTDEEIERFYVTLSDIVRHYLENRFGLRAPEMTTEEFLVAVSGEETLVEEHQCLLEDFLEHCDLVKFARYGPEKSEMAGAYSAARRLVDETKYESIESMKSVVSSGEAKK